MLRIWPDGLVARIAVILLAALALEFVGSELLFSGIEARRALDAQAATLAQHLAVAERLAMSVPEDKRAEVVANAWTDPLSIRWRAAGGPPGSGPVSEEVVLLRRQVAAAQPRWHEDRLSMGGQGGSGRLTGALRLQDGSWLEFDSAPVPDRAEAHTHLAPLGVLVASVGMVALFSAWTIARPLRALAKAADEVGKREGRIIMPTGGPREVRLVAKAFNGMQARLIDQMNERVQALAAVSHDLRTPIARLRLRSPEVADPDLRAGMENDVEEMERFVDSILNFLRGADPEPEQRIDLVSMVQTMVDDANDLGGVASYDGPRRLEIVTRPLKLHRAVANLVLNALRHGGEARVSVASDDSQVSITVEDRGPGIPEDEMEAVFRPFYRLEASRGRGKGGAGLGLSIVQRSVERLGGVVDLRNMPAGGLQAVISLPVTKGGSLST